ncbi:MAG: hypothetical protein V1778_02200 [bacterium]
MVVQPTVSIYCEQVQLEVVVPETNVWTFMDEFGKAFAIHHSEGFKSIRQVTSYDDHPNGWHVTVTIPSNERTRFLAFLRDFCGRHKIAFREPGKRV